jgi:hypothetical protein
MPGWKDETPVVQGYRPFARSRADRIVEAGSPFSREGSCCVFAGARGEGCSSLTRDGEGSPWPQRYSTSKMTP